MHLSIGLFLLFTLLIILSVAVVVWLVLQQIFRREAQAWRDQCAACGAVLLRGPQRASYQFSPASSALANACLLGLSAGDLRLYHLVPRHEIVIPLGQIARVALGGTRPAIRVYYHEGETEAAVALYLPDRLRQPWAEAIAQAAGVPLEREAQADAAA